MKDINQIQNEIIEDFSLFDDWMGKYEHLIEFGKSLNNLDEQYKTEDNLVKGCQSNVWLHTEMKADKLLFFADSDAIITKGIIGLLVSVLSEQSPKSIVDADLYFIEQIGLKEHLSPSRANGLVSMIEKMKLSALACSAKL
jgi:cysteine desulfuration protein SufE